MIITMNDRDHEQDVYASGKFVHADYQRLVSKRVSALHLPKTWR